MNAEVIYNYPVMGEVGFSQDGVIDNFVVKEIDLDNIIENEENSDNDNEDFNYCEECKIPMNSIIGGYECDSCGRTIEIVGEIKDCREESGSSMRMYLSNGLSVNLNHDYSRSQKTHILNHLNSLNDKYTGLKLPKDIIARVANTYNDIQKLIVEPDPNVESKKKSHNRKRKFVKRGRIRDEVLGSLIYYECMRNKIPRKRCMIADFMKLPFNGISRGDDILRTLHIDNIDSKIDLPLDDDPSNDFIDRYLEALCLTEDLQVLYRYKHFCLNLIEMARAYGIGINSISSSKIVGALWLLIVHENLNVTQDHLEKCSDKIRRNTWMRFFKAIEENKILFVDAFLKWGIPHRLVGNLVKKKDLDEFLANRV